MKYEIPEEEKSKERLFKKLPKDIRSGALWIKTTASTWSDVKKSVTNLISDGIEKRLQEIIDLRAIRTLFNSTQPVGEQRTNNMPVSPERRKND